MIGSIVLAADPVKRPDAYLLNLAPPDARGHAEARFDAYAPVDRAEGGYWGAGFQVLGSENILKELYEIGLGTHVEAWGFGIEPDFEGRIEEITFNLPPDLFTISLRTMANKAHMRADVDDDGVVERSVAIENTDSQDLFGTAEVVMAGGELSSGNVADQTVQGHINLRGLPKPAARFGGGYGEPRIEVFAVSYLRILERRIYNQTAVTGNTTMTNLVDEVIDEVGEFIGSVDLGANITSLAREFDIDRRAFDILMDATRLGDASARRWLLSILGRSCTNAIGRRVRLSPAAPVQPAAVSA